MRISELIKILELSKKDLGDIQVCIEHFDEGGWASFYHVEKKYIKYSDEYGYELVTDNDMVAPEDIIKEGEIFISL